MDLFDALRLEEAREAERRKAEGMAQAAAHAGDDWHKYALAQLEAVCRRQQAVHVDDLLDACTVEPASYNAFGAVWQRAIRRGWLVRSGRTRPSRRAQKHRHEYPIYVSTICEGGTSDVASR